MDIEESIKVFLPKYLSPEDQTKLLECIDDFPDNLESRFFTTFLKNEKVVFQGDGILNLPITNFPQKNIKKTACLITSNTCDIANDNKRLFFEPRLAYSAIIELGRYDSFLQKKGISKKKLNSHISAIRKQQVTQIFYLPKSSKNEESIVFLDRINNCSIKVIDYDSISDQRLFTLSNYGFYIFLLKLSISFTRITEKVNRK